jgi:Protein of unknown function (DUF3995)
MHKTREIVRLMILNLIAVAMSAILAAVAALHLYWAAGGLWPGRTPRELIDTVIGNPRRNEMPPAWLSALVGIALAATAMLPLIIAPLFWSVFLAFSSSILVLWGAMSAGFFAALVFFGRGIAGYLPFWRRLHPAQPFATLDALLYSPLCLLLGAAFIFIDFIILVAV